jgi:hypothetical protein
VSEVVKNPAVVECATDADSEGPGGKRKEQKTMTGLACRLKICKALNYGSSYFVHRKHVKNTYWALFLG